MKEARSKGCRQEEACKRKSDGGTRSEKKGLRIGHEKIKEGEKSALIFDLIHRLAFVAGRSSLSEYKTMKRSKPGSRKDMLTKKTN